MSVSSVKDAIKWLEEIANRGIVEFKFRDLPEELKNRKFLYKAINAELLISNKKEKDIRIWNISEDAKKRIKLFQEQKNNNNV